MLGRVEVVLEEWHGRWVLSSDKWQMCQVLVERTQRMREADCVQKCPSLYHAHIEAGTARGVVILDKPFLLTNSVPG